MATSIHRGAVVNRTTLPLQLPATARRRADEECEFRLRNTVSSERGACLTLSFPSQRKRRLKGIQGAAPPAGRRRPTRLPGGSRTPESPARVACKLALSLAAPGCAVVLKLL